MALVKFHYRSLPDHTKNEIVRDAELRFVHGKYTIIELWLRSFDRNVLVKPLCGSSGITKDYIIDYYIVMSQEKYTEFCLKWL